MHLISRNPIRVNVELYYGIMGKENLRKEGLNWTNWKVLDLIGWLWEVGGTNVQLSPKSTNIFDFIDFYYKASRKGESETKFSSFSSLLPVHISPHHFYLLPQFHNACFLWKYQLPMLWHLLLWWYLLWKLFSFWVRGTNSSEHAPWVLRALPHCSATSVWGVCSVGATQQPEGFNHSQASNLEARAFVVRLKQAGAA